MKISLIYWHTHQRVGIPISAWDKTERKVGIIAANRSLIILYEN